MDKENKAFQLIDDELAQISGGNKQISDSDAGNKYCSSFRSTESARLACDETRCKSCKYLLINGANYYCTIDKTPTMSP